MGISARDLSAAPSIEGFLTLTFAASVIPSCIPLATMAGTIVSDPGQVWHAGDRHKAVAAKAADAHDDLKKQVDEASKDWSDQAKQSFNARAEIYQQALQGTKSQHESIDTVLKVTAGVLGALGVASAAIGTLMALQAAAVISVSWLPGVDAGVFAEANGVGAVMTATLRALVTGFLKLILNVKNILSLFKNVMAKRLVQFAALGNLTGGAMLGGQMFDNPWQGVTQTA